MTTNEITAVAVTPDGRHAVSGSREKTLKVWDLDTGALVRTLEGHADRVTGVAVTADGRRTVSASWDKTLKVWNLGTGSVVHTLEGHTGVVWGVAVTPDGRQAVSGSSDETLKVWDLEHGGVLRTLEGHAAPVRGVAVTPDGRGVVSAAGDGTLKLWGLERGALVHTFAGHTAGVTAVTVTPDGRQAVSGSSDETLKVWDLGSGVLIHTLEGHTAGVTGVAATPDGKGAVSAASDGTLKVWDIETGVTVLTLEDHTGPVYDVAVTPDGRRAISASSDETLKVWDLETGSVVRTLEARKPVHAVEVTPDGRRGAANQSPVRDAQFTAYAPQVIEPSHWHPVYVYAHRSEPFQVDGVTRDPVKEVQEAAERAIRRESAAYAAVTGDSTGAILPDDQITLVLTLQQMEVSPPSHSFHWEDTTTFVRKDFFVNAGQELAGQQVAGTLVVLRGVLVIASASIVLKVSGRGDEQGVERTTIPISRKKVFPSYSHKDSRIVESVLDAAQALGGTEYLRDVVKLRSGEVWTRGSESSSRRRIISNCSGHRDPWNRTMFGRSGLMLCHSVDQMKTNSSGHATGSTHGRNARVCHPQN